MKCDSSLNFRSVKILPFDFFLRYRCAGCERNRNRSSFLCLPHVHVPARVRGALVAVNMLAITTGIVTAYLPDYALTGSGGWR